MDTGPLSAFLDRNEKNTDLRSWALDTLSSLRWPLYTSEPVLTETAYSLGTALPLLELVEAGELIVPVQITDHCTELIRIIQRYDDREVSIADASLVRMTEIWRETTVITTDQTDFSVYRRFGRERIPFLAPPR